MVKQHRDLTHYGDKRQTTLEEHERENGGQ